jgi:CBS domain-containing protein
MSTPSATALSAPTALVDGAADALRRHPVLGALPDAGALVDTIAAAVSWQRHPAGATVAPAGSLAARLMLVIDGAAVLRDGGAASTTPSLVIDAPGWAGAGVTPAAPLRQASAVAGADGCTVGFIDADALPALQQAHPTLRWTIDAPPSNLQAAASAEGAAPDAAVPVAAADPHLNLMQTPVRALVRRAPVTVAPQTSIRAAAELMREQRVSSVLVVDDGRLFGLVTDRDLRNRALADGLDPSAPVIDIATVAPLTVGVDAPGFEALLLMARHAIHHVPVMDEGRVVGMVTATDVTEHHGTSAVYLAGEIHEQTTLEGLVACASRVKPLQRHLADAGASAYATGHIVTAITDALTTRLLHLGEARLGPPPVDYAWVAAGSQARNEQTARSDQDNCLVLDDAYDAAAHGGYFESLARWTCDGLAACGYVHCPGEMMAMTDRWRQPQRVWAGYFREWVDTPEPEALMLTCVFFDVRVVAGRADLLEGLRAPMLRRTRDARLFLALMVGNALQHVPPLGLFGGLSAARSGPHKGTIDLKHGGTVPVIDLARIYALAAGHAAVNTHDRLAHAADSGEIGPQDVRDLRDAFEFLCSLRIRHQARLIAAGHDADNYLRPDSLSNFERGQLKDALGVVKAVQALMAPRYPGVG